MASAAAAPRGFLIAATTALFAVSALHAQLDEAAAFEQRNLPVLHSMFDSGDYDEVLRACGQTIRSGLPSPEWHTMLVTTLAELGRNDEALAAAEEMIKSHPESLPALMTRFKLARRLGKVELANETLRLINDVARKQQPSQRSAADLIALGEAAIAAGADAKKVIAQYFEPAKKKDKGAALADACLALGELALSKSDEARAADEFRAGLKQRASSAALRFGLARAFENSDRGKCMEILGQVLEGNPKHSGALVLRAELQIAEEQFADASKSFDQALAVNPGKPEAHALKAVIALLAKNDAKSADESLAAAMKQRPQNAEVEHLVGRCLSHAYRFTEGEEHQRAAVKFDPSFLPAKLQLCSDLFRLGKEDEAWRLAKEVADADGYNVQAHNILLLENEMKSFVTHEQDGFILRMTKQDEQVYADRALELLRDAREKLGTKYGMTFDKPVLVEFFPSQQDFAIRTFGHLGGQGMLGVCTGTVITMNRPGGIEARRSNWESTLWHEFCHVVTLGVTKNKMPRWLSEGISVYEEGRRDPSLGMKINADYRGMTLDNETLTPLSQLSSAFMNADSGEKLLFAYFESSQAVDFLIRKFGIGSFRGILGDLAKGVRINDAIERNTAPMKQLEKEFAADITQAAKDLAPKADWTEPEADELDPRDAAALAKYLQEHPDNLFALKRRARSLIEEGNWEEAIKTTRRLIELFPEDTEHGCGYELAAVACRGAKVAANETAMLREWAKRSGEATAAFQRLMELDSAAKDWKNLEQDARWMLAVNPFLKKPNEALAAALEASNRNEEAVAILKRIQILGADNPADINFRLARVLRDKDREASRRYVLDALADAPRHRGALNLLEQLHEEAAPRP